jgi:hypothetical protein
MRAALAAATTLACAAVLAGGTVVSAQASTAAGPNVGPVAGPAVRGSERFRIISVAASSRRLSVLATGAFTAGGYEVPGQVTDLRATDKMVFPNGTFLITRRITRQVLPLPTSACQVSETIHGSLSIGAGTGAYRGISGGGGFLLLISGVLRKSAGECGGPMTAYQAINYEAATIRG